MNEAWAKDDKGNILVNPLVGYETMIVGSKALALRLPFMVEGDEQGKPSSVVQLIINNASNAREFAQDILAAVEKIEQSKA